MKLLEHIGKGDGGRFLRGRILLLGAFSLLALVAFFVGKSGEGESNNERASSDSIALRTLQVHAVQVERSESYLAARTYNGLVEAPRKSQVGFDLSGRVELIHYEEGERVEKGAVLASLDTRRLDAAREKLRRIYH